ncbi:hypothetical protein PR048_006223 [Dryococelus australis]|uniref:Uncharacterized protein n=1 Tax=Dryococelus australis TaxID=614101 RepID=A0ABQ9IAE7_9NEOP|nr:hypothetical protein PR048_006223 [Dryococelus australis]
MNDQGSIIERNRAHLHSGSQKESFTIKPLTDVGSYFTPRSSVPSDMKESTHTGNLESAVPPQSMGPRTEPAGMALSTRTGRIVNKPKHLADYVIA